jgi:protoporphyrinogen/coproporphyrinogen III oxidase
VTAFLPAVHKRIAIIGGGISGVATAYQLALTQKHEAQFVLFEATGRLGGIVETRRSHGFVIECGPDSWVTEKPWARELAIELGLQNEIIPSNDDQRRIYLLEGEQLIAMPDGMRMMVPTDFDALRRSSLFSAEALRAYTDEPHQANQLKAAALAQRDDESVASFVHRHFGDEVTSKIAGPLLAGVFGGSIETLSVRAVMPAFVKMEREHGSLINALRQQVRDDRSGASIFTTLASGLGTLVDAMVAVIPAESIRLQSEVRSLKQDGSRWQISTDSGREQFDTVVVTTPAHVTRRLLSPLDPRFDSLLSMEATSAIVVALAFASEQAKTLHVPPGFGFLVPQRVNTAAAPSLLACTFVNQKFSQRVPEGGVLLRSFFGGETAPALLGESDDALVARTRDQLSRVLGNLPETVDIVVRRWPRSLPQYAVGHQARIAELEECAGQLPGLLLVGNAYHGVGLPDLIRDGRAAARRILETVGLSTHPA